MKYVLVALLATFIPVANAAAQAPGGSITGSLQDPQGRAVVGADVKAQAGDATYSFTTDALGQFRFLNLPPGRYDVAVTYPGFADLKSEAIVEVGKSSELKLLLRIGAVIESVDVTAAPPIVDPRARGTATNFTANELAAVPTARDPFSLARTAPGVLLDRVNVGGNETGQQPLVTAKGSRQQDTSWTLDGVEITDIAAAGQSPTYFNFDNFEEVHVSTAGQDIQARTGGVGLDFVTKRGTNRYRGDARGYFTNDALESSNVPDELKSLATPVTPETADHTKQISDYGFDFGGPLVANRAWFYGSYSVQDIRLVRRAGAVVDKTNLENSMFKVNWQATSKDMINFLFFNGSKIKDYRAPGLVQFDAPTATFHQDNWYSDFPLHGMWKIGDDRVIGTSTFLSAKYAYYNTGTALTPMGGMDMQAGRSVPDSRSVRLVPAPGQRAAAAHRQRGRELVRPALRRIAHRALRRRLPQGRRVHRKPLAGQPGPRARAVAHGSSGAGVPPGQRRQPRAAIRSVRGRQHSAEPGDHRCRRPVRPSMG